MVDSREARELDSNPNPIPNSRPYHLANPNYSKAILLHDKADWL